MKKIMITFLIFGSIIFAENKKYEVIEIKEETVVVKEISTENLITMEKNEAIDLGIEVYQGVTIGETFVDVMMPGSVESTNQVVVPMDTVNGVVTEAYNAK